MTLRSGSASDRAAKYVEANPGRPLTSAEIGGAIGVKSGQMHKVLCRAERAGRMVLMHGGSGKLSIVFDSARSMAACSVDTIWRLNRDSEAARHQASKAARTASRPDRVATRMTAGPSKIKCDPCAVVDYSRAKVTKFDGPRFESRWQAIPDSGGSIFADRPGYGGAA